MHSLHQAPIFKLLSRKLKASSSLISTLGVKITRRVVIRSEPTLFTSAMDLLRNPNRIVPRPGTATEWPSVAHALITSPIASQAALIAPLAIPLRRADKADGRKKRLMPKHQPFVHLFNGGTICTPVNHLHQLSLSPSGNASTSSAGGR